MIGVISVLSLFEPQPVTCATTRQGGKRSFAASCANVDCADEAAVLILIDYPAWDTLDLDALCQELTLLHRGLTLTQCLRVAMLGVYRMSAKTEVRIAVDVRCELGEGPIWHPERQALIWFDIYAQVLFESDGRGGPIRALGFGEPVSAAALLDASSIIVAGATGLHRINLETEERALLAPLEADNRMTRTNDCRVGPGGAFWIGTMGYPFAEGMGSLYRYQAGSFELLLSKLTTPNCIAFSPDGTRAYFSDTFDHRILVFQLDGVTGTPTREPELFLDLSSEGLCPDGAVVDAEGCLWNAQFGAGRLARYRPDGSLDRVVEFPVSMPTCPAFGGPDLRTMFVTSAWVGLSADERDNQPLAGAVFAFELETPGIPEHRMRLMTD